MRAWVAASVPLVLFLPLASASHDLGCTLTQPDYSTIITFTLPDGTILYEEERGSQTKVHGISPPGSGAADGQGTWIYQEANGLVGLQRGGSLEVCFSGPCVVVGDPIDDELCGHGPDQVLFGLDLPT